MTSSFNHILSSRPDPLDVLKTTAPVVQHARYVSLKQSAIERAADTLAQQRAEPPAWNYDYHFFDGTERTVTYLFLLDTLNFCFWGEKGDSSRWSIEYQPSVIASEAKQHLHLTQVQVSLIAKPQRLGGYWALAVALKRAAEKNPRLLDAEFLANISPRELADILHGRNEIPLFAERWRSVRELGTVLRDRWGGSAARLVESAQGDAARLARLIAQNFSSFNDIAVYDLREREIRRGGGKNSPPLPRSPAPVHILKRAQILVADLWGSFQGKSWGEFKNIEELTAFADYKLPQILRAWGILKYASPLAKHVNAQTVLQVGCPEEVEIRSATLWAVEFLRVALAARGRTLMSIQVDWILWQASQDRFTNMKPYHRVRTWFY